MKTYGEVDIEIRVFLISTLVVGEWLASLPFRFTPWYPLYKKLDGPHRASLDDKEKWKFLTLPGLELRSLSRPARLQSLYRYIIKNDVASNLNKPLDFFVFE
jgi:hypothetical protein